MTLMMFFFSMYLFSLDPRGELRVISGQHRRDGPTVRGQRVRDSRAAPAAPLPRFVPHPSPPLPARSHPLLGVLPQPQPHPQTTP